MKLMKKLYYRLDELFIKFFKKISKPLSRTALFVVFFWFGLLKIIAVSPANSLVEALLAETLPNIAFSNFIIWLGLYEMLIGIIFLIPKKERLAILLLIPHMIATFLPLVMLPDLAWQEALVPTIEGQYIIKNLVIIALAFSIAAQLNPRLSSKSY